MNGNIGKGEKAFNASLDVVKLFATLSTGALAFSIGLTSQATNNYPGGFRIALIAGWFVFFIAIFAGVLAQMYAPQLINAGNPNPNDWAIRGSALVSMGAFLLGVALLGIVLVRTTPSGAAGEPLAVPSPTKAIATAMTRVPAASVGKVTAADYVKGVDAVRPDQAAWHVQFELTRSAQKTVGLKVLDVYVDAVGGCTYVVQLRHHVVGPGRCLDF